MNTGRRRIIARDLLDLDTPAGKLAAYISELSELSYCAGRMLGIELEAWAWVAGDVAPPINYDLIQIDPDKVATLRRYAEIAQGWVHWRDEAVRFVDLAEWLVI